MPAREPPHPSLVSDERTAPRLPVSVVAHRLGIAPATLRTWDRRYGVGPTEHATGAHRRYGPQDLARLETMRRLVLEGVPPGEAARVVLEGGYDPATEGAQFPDRQGGLPLPEPRGPAQPLPGADEIARGLGRAATSLDSDAVLRCFAEQLARHGVVPAWEQVMVPVLVAAGARWEATGEGVEVEHLLSECVATALRQHSPPVESDRPVLLACAPNELHTLPLLVLSAALAERGHATRTLGAAVPAEALLAAVRRTRPPALFVWSQRAATGHRGLLEALPASRPPTAVFAGGPGWPSDLPARVNRADGLGAALDLMGRALRGSAL
ncbi:MAG: Mobile element protein [Frankiales bacterium]|nr:Mobile element protein [Frankiales bacterium]